MYITVLLNPESHRHKNNNNFSPGMLREVRRYYYDQDHDNHQDSKPEE